MDVVVDTTVIIAVVVNEPSKKSIVRITEGAILLAPASLPWEVGNAFSAMFKRRRLTLDQAREALQQYQSIPIQFSEIDLQAAVELSSRFSIYAYDAYMIACAIKHGAPLLTLDERLRQVALEAKVRVLEVTP